MVVRRRKKSRKLRGRTRSMGWGRIGQHRKSGSRGGKGAAGMHKHKWTWVIKYAPTWFGKHGFNPPRIRAGYRPRTINLGEVEELIEKFKLLGNLKEEDGKPVVDLGMLGYHKLLGRGSLKTAAKIIVPMASEEAKKKIDEVGGILVLSSEANKINKKSN